MQGKKGNDRNAQYIRITIRNDNAIFNPIEQRSAGSNPDETSGISCTFLTRPHPQWGEFQFLPPPQQYLMTHAPVLKC